MVKAPGLGDYPKRVRADTDHTVNPPNTPRHSTPFSNMNLANDQSAAQYRQRENEWAYATRLRLDSGSHAKHGILVDSKKSLFETIFNTLQEEGFSRKNIADLLAEFDDVDFVPDFMPPRL